MTAPLQQDEGVGLTQSEAAGNISASGEAEGKHAFRVLPARLAGLLLVVEWALMVLAVALWVSSKSYHPWMNAGSGLLAGSWAARWVRTGQVTRPTPIDLPLVLFLLSALVGLWAAPDQAEALLRLYLFLAAAGLFYALANSDAGALTAFSTGFLLFAAVFALYFASQHNWADQPAKFAAIGGMGLRLNQLVPDLGLYKPHPNVAAGILAVSVPVAVMRWIDAVQSRVSKSVSESAGSGGLSRPETAEAVTTSASLLGFGICLGVILFGLIMTESRASWLALAGALGLVMWWRLAKQLAVVSRQPSVISIFWAGVGIAVVAVVVTVVARPELVTAAFGKLPGPNSAVSRMEIYGQVWRLAQDTPFTGGGLAAFPALYSTYILDIPVLFLTHAHNAYLNLLVEQGWPGLIGYAGLLVVAGWAASRNIRQGDERYRAFALAGALGLAVVAIQGLADATLVASRAIPVLLVPAGLALAGKSKGSNFKSSNFKLQNANPQKENFKGGVGRGAWGVGISTLALIALAAFTWRSWLAAWHANLGTITHDRIELAGWSTGEWDDGSRASLYAQAEPEFRRALELDPLNRTANHRLGIAAGLKRDFAGAADYLQRAYEADPGHRGILKALGYTYVWLGEYDRAKPLLATIPEARGELAVYVWWWGTQGRDDLSKRAQTMVERLGE